MYEAAKERFFPEVFETEAAARQYIAGAAIDAPRPWIRRKDVKPMINGFILVSGGEVSAKGVKLMASDISVPNWIRPYADGSKMGWSQHYMAYAAYYGVDGSADDDPELGERIGMHRVPMVGYASRTGNKRNLAALRNANWRLLVSAKGELRTEGMRYALDNGAW